MYGESIGSPFLLDHGAICILIMPSPIFLKADWRHLVMLNYLIDPAILRPLVPAGTELDTWNGNSYVSVVGFLFLRTKVLGIPIPFHRNFEEVNLRFYVRHRGPEGWRRGVTFIKEIVPRGAIAWVARTLYNENYHAMPMRHRVDLRQDALYDGSVVEYGWRGKSGWNTIGATTSGNPTMLAPGSEEEFITEHYWGYAAQRNGSCVEYQVEHPSWRVWNVTSPRLDCNIPEIYGPDFTETLAGPPASAFVAEGSEIIVRKGVGLSS